MIPVLPGIPSVCHSLDPDQARHYAGPDLGPKLFAKVYQQTILAGKS